MSDTSAAVTILDERASPVRAMPKLAAHRSPGHRHLAFSVLLHDGAGRVLLQRRADDKHHFVGLWGNSCCSHPEPGEPLRVAAARRLAHELGMQDPVALEIRGAFWYRASDPVSGLVEHEYDVVLVGELPASHVLSPNPREVAEVVWTGWARAHELATRTGAAAPWLADVLRVADGPARPVPSVLVEGAHVPAC